MRPWWITHEYCVLDHGGGIVVGSLLVSDLAIFGAYFTIWALMRWVVWSGYLADGPPPRSLIAWLSWRDALKPRRRSTPRKLALAVQLWWWFILLCGLTHLARGIEATPLAGPWLFKAAALVNVGCAAVSWAAAWIVWWYRWDFRVSARASGVVGAIYGGGTEL